MTSCSSVRRYSVKNYINRKLFTPINLWVMKGLVDHGKIGVNDHLSQHDLEVNQLAKHNMPLKEDTDNDIVELHYLFFMLQVLDLQLEMIFKSVQSMLMHHIREQQMLNRSLPEEKRRPSWDT
jgi:hypothetical protein